MPILLKPYFSFLPHLLVSLSQHYAMLLFYSQLTSNKTALIPYSAGTHNKFSETAAVRSLTNCHILSCYLTHRKKTEYIKTTNDAHPLPSLKDKQLYTS